MSSCIVIEVSEAEGWNGRHGCKVIPAHRRSTILHPSREIAETEAVRLATEHPGRQFAVFEAASAAVAVMIPTHITLGGKVMLEAQRGTLVQIDPGMDAADLPF